jgi:DNA polymerase-3 subunit epsilon
MITELTGITQDDLSRYGHSPVTILNGVSSLMLNAEYIVAHNGNAFDKPLLLKECERHGVLLPRKHWIDTMTDIPYPESIKTRSLKHLAAEHGFLNPFAHRALFDVMTILNVMSRYDFSKIVERSMSPRVTVRAITMKPWEDDGMSNAVAKELGFRFDGGRKMWLKTVIESELQAFYQSAGDRIQMERVDG